MGMLLYEKVLYLWLIKNMLEIAQYIYILIYYVDS